MTMSVTSRSIGPWWLRAVSRASGPLAVAMTSYPAAAKIRPVASRRSLSSSTRRIVSPCGSQLEGAGFRAGAAASSVTGSTIVKVVPFPGWEEIWMWAPAWVSIP